MLYPCILYSYIPLPLCVPISLYLSVSLYHCITNFLFLYVCVSLYPFHYICTVSLYPCIPHKSLYPCIPVYMYSSISSYTWFIIMFICLDSSDNFYVHFYFTFLLFHLILIYHQKYPPYLTLTNWFYYLFKSIPPSNLRHINIFNYYPISILFSLKKNSNN